jgi:hypothetical protein
LLKSVIASQLKIAMVDNHRHAAAGLFLRSGCRMVFADQGFPDGWWPTGGRPVIMNAALRSPKR